jgi:hypothetical protein
MRFMGPGDPHTCGADGAVVAQSGIEIAESYSSKLR